MRPLRVSGEIIAWRFSCLQAVRAVRKTITILLMLHKIYLGLGSNVGDRRAALDAACAALEPKLRVLRRSPIYATAPWGFTEQAEFLNQVLEVESDLAPKELLKLLKSVELQLGRQRRFVNGPREIDVDILLYDDLVLDEDGLQVPHPSIVERAFVLVPLAELAPNAVIPGTGKTASEWLSIVGNEGVRLYEKQNID